MSNETVLNPAANATVVNPRVSAETLLNPALTATEKKLPAGTVIGDKYRVLSPLSVTAGEAELYLCSREEQTYVVKLYRRQQAIKPEVVIALKAIESPYIATLFEVGEHEGLPFEVLPYYKNGSLQGKRFSLEELKKHIIPCLNEALRVLHENGIIHKDLKPSNIMLLEDGRSVAIIDFGVSSVVDHGSTVLVTKTGFTPAYSAPETFRNLFLEESDYYSLGITLYALYCGYTPYETMSAEEIAQFTAVQRIPFPKDMPEALQDLISALTYFDITNRNQKKNPNRRWTYQEVDNWCKGKKQVIPGEALGATATKAIPAYLFLDQGYHDIPALVTALATHWKEGKKQLYRGLLSAFFSTFDPDAAALCLEAEEESTRTAGKDDLIFRRLLYQLHPELKGFCWLGQTYESLPALGRDILERLWNQDKSNYAYWDSILTSRLLSDYLTAAGSQNEDLCAAVAALETAHSLAGKTKRDAQLNYYTLAYLLSGQKLYAIGEKRLKSVEELTAYMKEKLDTSYDAFEDFCHSLIGYDDTLEVQLEAWLIALGKRTELDVWRRQLANS
jgi:predicted Ser/Thr protein kinase